MKFTSCALILGLLVAVPVSPIAAYVTTTASPKPSRSFDGTRCVPRFALPQSLSSGKRSCPSTVAGRHAAAALPHRMSLRDDEEGADATTTDAAAAFVDGKGQRRTRHSRVEKITTFGQLLSERMDTFGAAGFYDDEESTALEGGNPKHTASKKDGRVPMHAGVVKAGIQIAVVVWVLRKLKKMIGGGGSKDEVDDGVTTTKEQDATLHAWSCNNCGATLFVARGKEFRYFNKNYKCYICGNSGRENFTNTREEIIDRVGDDYEYTDIWDTLTKKDKKRLLKESGGNEEKAQQMAVDEANEAAGVVASQEDVATVSETAGVSEGAAATAGDEILDEFADDEQEAADAAPASKGGDDPLVDDDVSEPTPPTEESPAPAPKSAPAPAPKPAPAPAPAAKKTEKKADEDFDDIWDEFD